MDIQHPQKPVDEYFYKLYAITRGDSVVKVHVPPKELNLPPNILVKILKPLYGIAAAGTHWFQTYHAHHTDKLSLSQSSSNPCLLYNNDAIVALQTDDTLFACNEQFRQKEQQELETTKFSAKPTIKLTANTPINFNGASLTLTTNGITVTQSSHCQKLSMVPQNDAKSYIIQRARGAYISSVCQPQAAFDLSQAAQVSQPTILQIEALNKSLKLQMKGSGLRFIKLNEAELQIIVFTDSSLANNIEYSSQIRFIIVLTDYRNCNIIHWSSTKCKRVTRSVLASELYAMVAGFDAACVVKHTVDSIMKRKIPLVVCIDSYSLYECLVKFGTIKEKRLIIDIAAIRQAYERREIFQVIWIKGKSNPDDAMTKSQGSNHALDEILANKYFIDRKAWVDRDSIKTNE
ncbi:hypothetical protein K3495_g9356 [Podosphaera aphanis]|nr:hypothetical protein K3495_g9356 [Podosphaera aphanis]